MEYVLKDMAKKLKPQSENPAVVVPSTADFLKNLEDDGIDVSMESPEEEDDVMQPVARSKKPPPVLGAAQTLSTAASSSSSSSSSSSAAMAPAVARPAPAKAIPRPGSPASPDLTSEVETVGVAAAS